MPVGSVIGHQVEDDFQPRRVRGFDQYIEILDRAEQRIDPGVIGNVVAEIGHRRGKYRRQPDRVNAERAQVRQPRDDPGDVADPVGIGILKRSRIDLIENAVPPPVIMPLIHLADRPLLSRRAVFWLSMIFRKTGSHFSGSCCNARAAFRFTVDGGKMT